MDAEQYNTIDFANSKPDSYNATSSDVMSELNAYFKSYIANAEGKKGDIQETLDGILNGSSFDDAIEAIHKEHSESSSDNEETPTDISEHEPEQEPEDDTLDTSIEQNVLDVEILDQHIDKYGLTGGSDATRAIENMAGGGLNNNAEELDDIDTPHGDLANNMLGMQGGDVRLGKNSAMKGYSGVTNEIRIKGNRVTERDRSAFNYRSEDGRLDMGMLGGSFEDDNALEEDANEELEDSHKPIFTTPYPTNGAEEDVAEPEAEMEHAEPETEEEVSEDTEEYTSSDYSEEDNGNDNGTASMASEIDLVLNQLRNKTARTLTGGTVNIRRKVVLTDMYPYIVRS